MARYLLDTEVFIHLRRRSPAVVERFRDLARGDAAVSIISYGELAYGAAKSSDPARAFALLGEIVELIELAPLPNAAGRIYGEVRAMLKRSGTMIGNNDLWIAAHARAAALTLVTSNEREFRRVPDLAIENWTKALP